MYRARILFALIVCVGLVMGPSRINFAGVPMGSAFEYEGTLVDGNDVLDGIYDLQFKLFDDPDLGTQQGMTNDIGEVDVIDGYCLVELDFGEGVLDGSGLWLEIGYRTGDLEDPNVYTVLTPRQPLVSMPYAVYAKMAGGLNLPENAQEGYVLTSDANGLGSWQDSPITPWSTSGLNIYRSSGNVGIGTSSPEAKLDVDGQIKIRQGSPGSGKVLTSDSSGLGSWQTPPSTPWSTSGSNVYRTSGNVGIGTSSPGKKLEVAGEAEFDGALSARDATGIGLETSDGDLGLWVNNETGKVGIKTKTPIDELDVIGDMRVSRDLVIGVGSGSSYVQSGALHVDGSGWYKALWVEGSDAYFSDDVGIGMEFPGAKLDVNGQIKIRGGSPGSGKVLTSDSSGLGSWQTPSGGGDNLGNHTATQNIKLNGKWLSNDGGNEGVYVTNVGRVGIATSSPHSDVKLDVYGAIKMNNAFIVNMYSGSGDYDVRQQSNGWLTRDTSSRRYKTDISDLPVNIEDVLHLRPVQFRWKRTGKEDIGLIAEEVSETVSDLVVYDEEGRPDAVKYNRLAVYLLEVIKTQQQKIDALEETVAQYETLSERLAILEESMSPDQDNPVRLTQN